MERRLLKIVMTIALIVGGLSVSAQNYYVDYDGIGPVKIDASLNDVPQTLAGLYDKAEVVKEYDDFEDMEYFKVTFYLNGSERFYARATNEGTIFDVKMLTNELRTKSGAYDQMPAREFIKLPGVSVNVYAEADFSVVEFTIDNIVFGVDYYSYSASGQKKVDAASRTGVAPKFVPADFLPEATVVLGGFMF